MVTVLSHVFSVVLKVKKQDQFSRVYLGFSSQGDISSDPSKRTQIFESLVPIGQEPEVGSTIDLSSLILNSCVDVTGYSIGKGFSGTMKRHGFSGLKASHGVSISHRSQGSTGQCQDPGKVFKGKKMAGRKGNSKVTIRNLRILELDDDVVAVGGAVPGPKGARVMLRKSIGWRSKKNVC